MSCLKLLISSLVHRFVYLRLVLVLRLLIVLGIFLIPYRSFGKKGNSDKQIGQYQGEECDFNFSYFLIPIPVQSLWFSLSHRSNWMKLSSFATSSLHAVQGFSGVLLSTILTAAVKAAYGILTMCSRNLVY